ncbi:sperm-associated antigen 8-like [Sycon ciliatum]|uniref:sperm-associated antigen 8-like n=1 Tax=Sycon ciliatum TaxID=27933 RepID=UPI0020AD1789
MSLLGRNPIPVNNSRSKTLVENWVEERGVKELLGDDSRPMGERFRDGHQGLLSTGVAAASKDSTESHQSMSAAPWADVGLGGTTTGSAFSSAAAQSDTQRHRTVGARRQQLEQQVREYVAAEVEQETAGPEPEMDCTSTTRSDYTSDYVPRQREHTREHSVYGEAPASFWQAELESGRAVDGITVMPSQRVPFRKNATFSTPVEQALDGQDR